MIRRFLFDKSFNKICEFSKNFLNFRHFCVENILICEIAMRENIFLIKKPSQCPRQWFLRAADEDI